MVGDQTQIIVVGSIFTEEDAQKAVSEHTDLIVIGRGTLIDPFWSKIKDGRGKSIVSEISPEQVPATLWTSGLHEAFTREDSLGLPKLPGQESILHLHQGIYDPVEHR